MGTLADAAVKSVGALLRSMVSLKSFLPRLKKARVKDLLLQLRRSNRFQLRAKISRKSDRFHFGWLGEEATVLESTPLGPAEKVVKFFEFWSLVRLHDANHFLYTFTDDSLRLWPRLRLECAVGNRGSHLHLV